MEDSQDEAAQTGGGVPPMPPPPGAPPSPPRKPAAGVWVLLALVAVAVVGASTWVTVARRTSAPQHRAFVALADRVCRTEAAEFARIGPQPTSAVLDDLNNGRPTPQALAFLGDFAQAFITVGTHAEAQVEGAHLPASDRTILAEYEAAARKVLPALIALRDDARAGDASAVQADLQRVRELSQQNSDFNQRLGLTDCGTLQHPATVVTPS